MSESVLERRPLYGIGTVARLTGLKPDTLRVWERRYGLGASFKSDSGRRQYTQGDLEHLQLIAALVGDGARIGEIAGAPRKTLETLLKNVGQAERLPDTKPRVAFVGRALCEWLDNHQGCLTGVDAILVNAGHDALDDTLREAIRGCDALVVFVPGIGASAIAAARELRDSLGASHILLACEYASKNALEQARAAQMATLSWPPDPAQLAFELSRLSAEKLTREGQTDLGDLVHPRPREFNAAELSAAVALQNRLGCECPRHLAQLVESLAHFEDYSAACSTENWQDAAIHARVYAFTAQARWLVERALQAVLEDHEEDFASALAQVRARGGLGDAA